MTRYPEGQKAFVSHAIFAEKEKKNVSPLNEISEFM